MRTDSRATADTENLVHLQVHITKFNGLIITMMKVTGAMQLQVTASKTNILSLLPPQNVGKQCAKILLLSVISSELAYYKQLHC